MDKLLETCLDVLENKVSELDFKFQKVIDILENNISDNCERINDHINFIEKCIR